MKIAVVGIGGTGSAAARHLARAGHEVVGFEQFSIGHDRGSSHGHSRIIRYTYPDLLYTQMMGDAYPLWAELEEEAVEELFVRCGGLYLGPREHPEMRATEHSLQDAGLEYSALGAEALRERFPPFLLQPGEVALWQRESGFLRADRCVLANARLARAHGAVLREQITVRDIRAHTDGVLIRTENDEEHVFDRAIVTAGAWMGKLFGRLGLRLNVTRQQIQYIGISRHQERFAPPDFPVWIDAATHYYGFPMDESHEGVKIAHHQPGETTDPDEVHRPISEAHLRATMDYAIHRFPDLSDMVTHASVCLYTNTPDEHFIIDCAPGLPDVWLVSGCSGHGFKFTVLLGKIAATLAIEGTYPRDLSRFRMSRFSGE